MTWSEASHHCYCRNRTEKGDILLSYGYFYKIKKVNRKPHTFTITNLEYQKIEIIIGGFTNVLEDV